MKRVKPNIYSKYMTRLFPFVFLLLTDIANAALIDTLRSEATILQGSQTVQYVPISIDDIFIIVPAGTGMPSEPGVNGDATIAGIDSDGDGIRDDVERRISAHYSNNASARAYSYMIAKRLQAIIVNSANKTTYIQAISELSFAENCLNIMLPTELNKGTRLVLPWVMNTYQRSIAYINARALIGGEKPPTQIACQ